MGALSPYSSRTPGQKQSTALSASGYRHRHRLKEHIPQYVSAWSPCSFGHIARSPGDGSHDDFNASDLMSGVFLSRSQRTDDFATTPHDYHLQGLRRGVARTQQIARAHHPDPNTCVHTPSIVGRHGPCFPPLPLRAAQSRCSHTLPSPPAEDRRQQTNAGHVRSLPSFPSW